MPFPRYAVIAVCLVASCGHVLPPAEKTTAALHGTDLATAENLLAWAKLVHDDPITPAVYQLRAAEIAWTALDTGGGNVKDMRGLTESQRHALRIINTATEDVAVNLIGQNYQPEKQFSYAGFSYRVSAGIVRKPGIYPLASLASARPAHEVKHTLCRDWHTTEGVGVPCAPQWKRPTDPQLQRFVSNRSYMEPMTAVLTFGAPAKPGGTRTVALDGYDPTTVSRVNLGHTEYPLAADFTAPIVEQASEIEEFKIALTGMIHPGVLDSKLILLQPYDPQRIPVVLIHGLSSHPRMWKNVLNDLGADPKLRGRYQFMLFYYPTGWPISYSAMRLREELAALTSLVGHPKKMVLIGHSMGGLLAQMQVTTPGRKIWDNQLGQDADRLYTKLPDSSLVKRVSLFTANPNIGREIYICTPHRGSGIADLSIIALAVKLLTLPTTITSAFIDLPSNLTERGQLTGVGGLSTTNPLYKALDEIPIQVPYHTIVGDRGRGDTPHSSDGIVPYWSSHLASAKSELIVPGDHGAFDLPQAIHEVRRILLLNAGLKDIP